MRSRVVSAGIVLCALAAPVRAQDTTAAVRPGTLVRLRTRQADVHGHAVRCEARVSEVRGDTLTVTNVSRWGGCPRQTYAPSDVASLEISRGHRGSRLAHAGLGLLGGAIVGATLGWALIGDGCETSGCDDGDFAVAIVTFLGVVTGGVTGTIVGVALPAGPKWAPLPADTPVRVAGLALRPSIRWVGAR
jgi:hypothetical protein